MGSWCICCSEPTGKGDLAAKDRFTGETFKLLRCERCDMAWLDVPDYFDPAPYYPEEYYGQKGCRFDFLIEFLVKLFRKARARFVLRFWSGESGRILDIGCGRALMLAELQKLGWQCVGTEYSEVLADFARNHPRITVYATRSLESCGLDSDSFDVVTLWHVLEHLQHPAETLREIKRILKPDGLLVIEVPNFGSWQARLNRAKWLYLEAPRHFYHFSPHSLQEILKANRFSIMYIGTLSFELGLFGMFQSLLNLIVLRENLLYSLMNKKQRQDLSLRDPSLSLSLALLVIFAVPCLVLAFLLEVMSVLMARGGVIRVVASNLK